jgi:hypothetical protein
MTDSAIYNMLNPFAKTITNGGIDLGLSHMMYAEENEKHPSLFLVRTSSDSFVERDNLDTLRFENAECGAHGVPVMSVELMFNQGVTQV